MVFKSTIEKNILEANKLPFDEDVKSFSYSYEDIIKFSTSFNDIRLFEPRRFLEVLNIVDFLKSGNSAAISMPNPSNESQRIVDFISGAVFALAGEQNRYSDKIFVFKPKLKDSLNLPMSQYQFNIKSNIYELNSFDDVLEIVESLKIQNSIKITTSLLSKDKATRAIDFISGACYALDGVQENINEEAFIFRLNVNSINQQSLPKNNLLESNNSGALNDLINFNNIEAGFYNDKSTLRKHRNELVHSLSNEYFSSFFIMFLNWVPPVTSKEQINQISDVLKTYKTISRLTVEQIINRLPPNLRISRTAINTYLYGTVKSPPTREFIIELFKVFKPSSFELNLSLKLCGFAIIEDKAELSTAKDLLLEVSKRKKYQFENEAEIEKLSDLLCSLAELYLDKTDIKTL